MGIVAIMSITSIIAAGIVIKDILTKSGNVAYCLKRFLFLLLIDGIAYWGLVSSNHYSVDSFNLYYDMSPYWHMQLGRYINCGTILWALKLGINQVVAQRFFMAIWIITITISVYIISEVFTRLLNCKGKNNLIISGMVSLAFVNVFAMELMLFPEMAMVFMFSNLAIGVLVYIAVSDINRLMKWCVFLWFVFVALGSYQSYIGIIEAFVLAALFIKYRDNIKLRYIDSIIALAIGGVASISNVLIVKIMISKNLIADSGRGATFNISDIMHNLVTVIKYQVSFWKSADGILPNGIMPIVAILIIFSFGYYIYKLPTIENKLFIIIIVFGCYVLAFVSHIIEKNLTLTPRSNIAIWSLIAVVLIISYCNISKLNVRKLYTAIVTILLLLNIYVMQDMVENEAANNAIDMTEAKLIANRIVDYENETGNYVTNIATVWDSIGTYYEPSSRYHNGELGGRIMATGYSNYRLIGYELDGRWINSVEMNSDVYQEYFAGKNWDNLNLDEQLVFVDDTLYIAIY